MMEAARDLEHFRDPLLRQADVLESAHELRRAIYDRARELQLEIPPVPARPDPRIRDQVEALASVAIDLFTSHLADVRRWDKAAKLARQLSPAKPSTRDSQLVMLAALCQQINAWARPRKRMLARSGHWRRLRPCSMLTASRSSAGCNAE